ncbi:zinc finger, CCHC-type containing protein [Tanacetum coccineum]
MVRSMMNLTTLPKSFWGYALESAISILNMVPTKKVERTPYEICHEKDPKLSYLRVWGCEAHVKRDTPDKLDPRSIKCIFVGYPKETMGYYFYYPLKNKIFVARNAKFFENSLMVQEASGSHGLLELSGSDKGLELIQEEDTQHSKNTSEVHNEVAPIEEYELGDLNEPPNYKAALSYPESDKWLEAMNTEMQSMKDNQVWILVELPPNGRIVESKWLFKKKTIMDGKVQRMGRVSYASAIGSIMYAVRCTRPDVAFAQNLCSCFQQNPGEIHWTAVKTILKYLRNTKDMVLVYGAKPEAKLRVSCYADAKSEYIDAVEASKEVVWMRKFVDGLGDVVPSNKRPMEMLCDNEPAIAIANDPGILKGARHFRGNITIFLK